MKNQKASQGRYVHYKGKSYDVLGEAYDFDSHTKYIIYRQNYSYKKWWIRPKEMFFDQIEHDGTSKNRFNKVNEDINIPIVKHKKFTATHTETGEKYTVIYKSFYNQYLLVLENQLGEQIELDFIPAKKYMENNA